MKARLFKFSLTKYFSIKKKWLGICKTEKCCLILNFLTSFKMTSMMNLKVYFLKYILYRVTLNATTKYDVVINCKFQVK